MAKAMVEKAVRRLALVGEGGRVDPELLRLAAMFADPARVDELLGLFVEDVRLIRAAELPLTREIGVVSGRVRELHVGDVVALMQRQADVLRDQLAAIAAELQLPLSFRIARGRLLEQAMRLLPTVDLLFLCARQGGGMSARPAMARDGVVSALIEADGDAGRVIDAAWRLAGGRPDRLLCVVPSGAGAGMHAARRLVAGRIGARPEAVHVVEHTGDVESLSRSMRGFRSSVLVLSAAAAGALTEELGALFDSVLFVS
ncbi:MAG: hypothetical protein NFCOHLIN_01945 [Gammaproteobacteria bacterium]|nr:hypothetical protein [Gammaproteobacteria bacterium]